MHTIAKYRHEITISAHAEGYRAYISFYEAKNGEKKNMADYMTTPMHAPEDALMGLMHFINDTPQREYLKSKYGY